MGKLHSAYEKRLLGCKGVRFVAEVFRAETGRNLHPRTVVTALREYLYRPVRRPPENRSGKMRLDILFILLDSNLYLTIGVEVKTDINDLLFDIKLASEIGVADLLFLAVPRALIPAARFLISRQDKKDVCRIGLADLDSGDVVIFPERSQVFVKERDVLADAIVLGGEKLNLREGAKSSFVQFRKKGQIRINEKYEGLLAKTFCPRFPSPEEYHERFQASELFKELQTSSNAERGQKV